MAIIRFTLEVDKKRLQEDTARNLIRSVLPEDWYVRNLKSEKVKTDLSRADRLADALADIENGQSEIEALKDELSEWKDNLPESLQDGEKASMLEDGVDTLEEALTQLEEVTAIDVEFPGMFG